MYYTVVHVPTLRNNVFPIFIHRWFSTKNTKFTHNVYFLYYTTVLSHKNKYSQAYTIIKNTAQTGGIFYKNNFYS